MRGVSVRWVQEWMTGAIAQNGPHKAEGPEDDGPQTFTARSSKSGRVSPIPLALLPLFRRAFLPRDSQKERAI